MDSAPDSRLCWLWSGHRACYGELYAHLSRDVSSGYLESKKYDRVQVIGYVTCELLQ